MKELSGYTDDDLLAALDKARERKGRIEQEIEARFAERCETVIETEHWTATQWLDIDRPYVSLSKREPKETPI